jgi:hypothetical protein
MFRTTFRSIASTSRWLPIRPRRGDGDAKALRATIRAESAIAMAQQAQPIAKVGVTGDR